MPDPITAAPRRARPCPPWLAERLRGHGGSVPFRTYMDWVLHDPEHGAYASGRLRIAPGGDFATAPSLGPDFAALLAPQLADWLQQLGPGPLALIEAGPGEGHLARDLGIALARDWPQLAQRLELVLVDPSDGLVQRQRRLLADLPLPLRWCSWAELAADPLVGVVLAHEVLDALPVERIVWDGRRWCRQEVALRPRSAVGPHRPRAGNGDPAAASEGLISGALVDPDPERAEGGDGPAEPDGLELVTGAPLEPGALQQLAELGLQPPGPQRPAGWSSEWHPALAPWLADCGAGLQRGVLLVIDYALEAYRYYAPQRSNGTLMAYRAQQASHDPLLDPGHWDLTAHLCLESLSRAAATTGWRPLGQRRQGEALLALGLAQRLHGLQQQACPQDLATLLARREALLRLVDPAALGDFRWIACERGEVATATPAFLLDPPLA
ncbi:MAG: class I SAM-dependent methyltransferase [Cyanobium sp.]